MGTRYKRPHASLWGKRDVKPTREIAKERYGEPPSGNHNIAHATANGCKGSLCVNPDHIRWATHSENTMDQPPEVRSHKASVAGKATWK